MQRDEHKEAASTQPQQLVTQQHHSSTHRHSTGALVDESSSSSGSKRAAPASASVPSSDRASAPPSKSAKVSKTHSPNSSLNHTAAAESIASAAGWDLPQSHRPAPPPHSERMASQVQQPAPVAAAASASASSASAGAAGAGAGAGAASASSSAFQPNAAQRHQLAEMRSLQALSSFERSNSSFCSNVYHAHSRMIESTITQMMNDPSIELAEKHPDSAVKVAPMSWRFEQFPALNRGNGQYTYVYETDIPGTTYMMTPQPSFYLPKDLKLGRNCREVRQKKKNAAIQLKNSQPDPNSMSFAESAAAAAAPPPTAGRLPDFAEWAVDKLCDNELQSTVEASGVLNSWDEGSYLSVVKTDGDGNCLAHAVMTAVYGMSDSKGSLRDAIFWEMSSAARKAKYLERYMHEQARLAATPGAVASQAAVDKYLQDKDNVAALTKEFERCTERLSNIKNFCEPIHVFVLSHVMRRPIIVYGSKHFGGAKAAAAAPEEEEEEEEKKGGESGMVDASPAASSSSSAAAAASASAASSVSSSAAPLNSMVGIYLPIDWGAQHKFDQSASADNPQLKPICLLYSCADEATGQGGHFSALTTTDDMLPCHGLVPLQQWDGYNSSNKSCNNLSSAACATPAGMDLGEPALPLLPLRFLLPQKYPLEGNTVHVLNKHMEITQTATGHWYAKMQLNKCMEYLKQGWQMYLQLAQTLYITIDSGVPILGNASPDAAMAAAMAVSSKDDGVGVGVGGFDPLGGLGDTASMEYARLLQAQELGGFSDADDVSLSSPGYDDDDEFEYAQCMPEVDEQCFLSAIDRSLLIPEDRWKRPVRWIPPRYLDKHRALVTSQNADPQYASTFRALAVTVAQLMDALNPLTTTRVDHARVLQACSQWAHFQSGRWSKQKSVQSFVSGFVWHEQMWYTALLALPASPRMEVPQLSLAQVLSIAHVFNISVDHLQCATFAAQTKHGLPDIEVLPDAAPLWDGASQPAKHIIAKLQAHYNKRQAQLEQFVQTGGNQQIAQQQQQQEQPLTVDQLRAFLADPGLEPPIRQLLEQSLCKLLMEQTARGQRSHHMQTQPQSTPQQQQQQQQPIAAPQPVRAPARGVTQGIPVNPHSVARAAAVAQASGQSGVVQPVASAVPGSSAFGSVAPVAGVAAPPAAVAAVVPAPAPVPAHPPHSRSNSEADEEAQLRQAMAMSMQADADAHGGAVEDGEIVEHADADKKQTQPQ